MARTYVVTGAASGIGLATAARLDALGHRVITVDRREADVVADLSTTDGRRGMVDAVADRTGGVVDAVVASAGTANRGRTDLQVKFFVRSPLSTACADAARGHRPTSGRGSRRSPVPTRSTVRWWTPAGRR